MLVARIAATAKINPKITQKKNIVLHSGRSEWIFLALLCRIKVAIYIVSNDFPITFIVNKITNKQTITKKLDAKSGSTMNEQTAEQRRKKNGPQCANVESKAQI